jgi:RNA polymerase sigma factor (sigma-70 family)
MYITQLSDYRNRIEILQERIQCVRSALEIGEPRLRNMPSKGNGKDGFSEAVTKLLDLEQRLVNEVIEFETDIQLAEWEISTLPEQQQRIMRMKYIHNMSYKQIADREGYSVGYCRNIAARARPNLESRDIM